jgi:ribA/ribD-fused uncharacterized protein
MAISAFVGKYHFLSNFFVAPTAFDGVIYPSSEAAYQAAKSLDPEERKAFRSVTPGKAKRMGQELRIRPDWDEVKVGIMTAIVRDKFSRNAALRDQILATGDEELIEGNYWRDRFWGVCEGTGQNHLGKILMQIRSEIRGAPG